MKRKKTDRGRGGVPASGRIIMGRNALREVLRHSPGRLLKVLTTRGGDADRDSLVQSLAERGVPLELADAGRLTEMAGSESHQSFVAVVESPALDLRTFLDAARAEKTGLVLMLDAIEDPHNVGACLRAAECFGVAGAVRSKNRGAPLSAVASKASAGASELVPWIEVANLSQAVRQFKEEGFWIAAADVGPDSIAIDGFVRPEKLVLILGSEGGGVHKLLLDQADYRLRIPLHGRIDSLNVSQAAAVLLFALTR